MAMELFEKGTYMYSLMADYWVLNRKLLSIDAENLMQDDFWEYATKELEAFYQKYKTNYAKGSNKLTNACYAVRNPNCDNYLWFATFRDYLKGRKIIRNHKKEMAKLKKWLQEEIQNGNLTSTCVVTPDDRKNEDCCDYWGAGFAWYKNYGVEYNFCVNGEENASAIYLMRYNPNMDYMETDHDKYIHYEINFEEKDWKERFLEKMGLVLLNYYSEECAC